MLLRRSWGVEVMGEVAGVTPSQLEKPLRSPRSPRNEANLGFNAGSQSESLSKSFR